MKDNSYRFNIGSESNGSLMRITPLVIYCIHLTDDEIEKIVETDISLTHSSKIVDKAAVTYVIAAAECILTGDSKKAI